VLMIGNAVSLVFATLNDLHGPFSFYTLIVNNPCVLSNTGDIRC
jgi:hypothetical protein